MSLIHNRRQVRFNEYGPVNFLQLVDVYAKTPHNITRPEVTEMIKAIYYQQNTLMAKRVSETDTEEHLFDRLQMILRAKIPSHLPTVDSAVGIPLTTK